MSRKRGASAIGKRADEKTAEALGKTRYMYKRPNSLVSKRHILEYLKQLDTGIDFVFDQGKTEYQASPDTLGVAQKHFEEFAARLVDKVILEQGDSPSKACISDADVLQTIQRNGMELFLQVATIPFDTPVEPPPAEDTAHSRTTINNMLLVD